MSRKKTAAFNFETALEDLEAIVEQMEKGGLSLEEAMAEFAKGVKLTRDCHQALQQAEQQVKLLLEKQGEFTLVDFATDEFAKFDKEDKKIE